MIDGLPNHGVDINMVTKLQYICDERQRIWRMERARANKQHQQIAHNFTRAMPATISKDLSMRNEARMFYCPRQWMVQNG